ncbi:MAG: ribosome maturation factor RimM [Oscillospiraceae bacterium]
MKQYLETGEFVSTHGIGGELKLYPWSDDPGFLVPFRNFYFSPNGGVPVKAEQVRVHKNTCIVKLAGVSSIEQARPFIGKTVYIARHDIALPAGRVFVQDLLGAAVKDAETGREYGRITNITHPGRHDVYEITAAGGQVYLFPAVEAFLAEVNPEEGFVLVRPIAGMFDEEEPLQSAAAQKAEKPARRARGKEKTSDTN